MHIAVGENSMALMQQPITNSLENIYSLTFFLFQKVVDVINAMLNSGNNESWTEVNKQV